MEMDAGVLRLRRAIFELGAGGRGGTGIIIVIDCRLGVAWWRVAGLGGN